MALKWLIEGTPAQLNDLREIALKGKNSQTVAIASEGIATHGDPFQDVPLLLKVYEKNFGNDHDEKIESALSKLDEAVKSPQNAVFAISNVIISGLYSDGIREFRLFTGPSNLRV
jgi:hypothetical protein